MRPETIKLCSCGHVYKRAQFVALPQPPNGGEAMGLLWRNCACGSTIAMEAKSSAPRAEA